ncbi:MAG TPA: MFS transporter [Gaiellaceae bacterium]|nr:MFS transporter [Gaiellaceae bacterium]
MPRSTLWRDRAFVRLFAANAISQLGTQFSLLALPLTALVVLHEGALEVSLLRTFGVLPFVFFSLPAGVWIDRLRRRPLMIAADAGRALALASIPVAFWLGRLSLTQLYVVVAVSGTLSVLFDVSYLSFLPGLVPRERLGEANAKLLGSQAAAQSAGPSIAGVVVGAVGAAVAVLADSASFALSAILVAAIRGREQRPEAATTRKRDDLLEGLRYVFSQPYLRTLTIWTSLWNLFASGYGAIVIVYYVRDLHWSPTEIGVVMAIAASGLVGGSLVNERLVARLGIGAMIAFSGIVFSATLVATPLVPAANAAPIIAAIGFAGSTAGFFANVNQLTLRQAITPQRLLGRMNSVVRFMYWGTIPLGSLLAGLAAGPFGLRATLVAAGIGSIASCIPIMVSRIRSATVTADARAPGDGGLAAPAD